MLKRMLYMITGLLCVTLIGFIAHRVGICLVRGVAQLTDGRPALLMAILFSGLWVGAYSVVAAVQGWEQPFTRHALHPLFAVGGFIFGVGASINQGCSVSTLHQFARGNLAMLFTMTGGISISENPVFRFFYNDNGATSLTVRATDTEGNVFESELQKMSVEG